MNATAAAYHATCFVQLNYPPTDESSDPLEYTQYTNCSMANQTRLGFYLRDTPRMQTHTIHKNTEQNGAIGKKIGMRSNLSFMQENV